MYYNEPAIVFETSSMESKHKQYRKYLNEFSFLIFFRSMFFANFKNIQTFILKFVLIEDFII
jgi:hypothetical protein